MKTDFSYRQDSAIDQTVIVLLVNALVPDETLEEGLKSRLRSMLVHLNCKQILIDQGHAFVLDLPPDVPGGDSVTAPFFSQAILFEDGKELGPRNVPHARIRTKGHGRYSHWENQLYFSASDNSSPYENEREYHLLVPAVMFGDVEGQVPSELGSIDLDEKTPMERFEIARQVFRQIWRHTPLPDHGRSIEQDLEFEREFTRVSPENDVTWERKYALDQLFKLVLSVDGDIAECGTYKGGSAFFLARHIIEEKLNKRLCLFDSFGGLSAPTDLDGNYWHSGALPSAIIDVEAALVPLGRTPFVEFYQGWIPDRFGEVEDRRFCFVHIDVDLHQPTLDSIAFFYPRMEEGGIILLDDYGFDSCPGVTIAIDQFMGDKSEPIINLPSGGAFIVKRAVKSR